MLLKNVISISYLFQILIFCYQKAVIKKPLSKGRYRKAVAARFLSRGVIEKFVCNLCVICLKGFTS